MARCHSVAFHMRRGSESCKLQRLRQIIRNLHRNICSKLDMTLSFSFCHGLSEAVRIKECPTKSCGSGCARGQAFHMSQGSGSREFRRLCQIVTNQHHSKLAKLDMALSFIFLSWTFRKCMHESIYHRELPRGACQLICMSSQACMNSVEAQDGV